MKLFKQRVVKDGVEYTDYYLSYKNNKGEERTIRVRPVFKCDYWRMEEQAKEKASEMQRSPYLVSVCV